MIWNPSSLTPIIPPSGGSSGSTGPGSRPINPSAPLAPASPLAAGAASENSPHTPAAPAQPAALSTEAFPASQPTVAGSVARAQQDQNSSIAHHGDTDNAREHTLLPDSTRPGIPLKAAAKAAAKQASKSNSKKNSPRGIDLWLLALVGLAAVFSSLAFLRVDQLFAAVRDLNTKVGSINTASLAAAALPSAKPAAPNPISDTAVDVSAESDDPAIGATAAKVTIIEFSDFQCPFCKKFQPTVQQILSTYAPTQVRLVYRDFPLDFHEEAEPAAIAAQCVFKHAGDQAFFDYHDQLFERQEELGDALYLELGKKIPALDQADFKKCMDDKETLAEVQQDAQAGAIAGVNGTPATFVNGRLISGALPFAQVKAVIDEELNK